MEKIFDNEYRLMAKRLNQRLVELEKRNIYTSTYNEIKIYLAEKGRKRFSETGKANSIAELNAEKEKISHFLEEDLTTLTSVKENIKEHYDLENPSITEEGDIIDKNTGEYIENPFQDNEPQNYSDYNYVDEEEDFEYNTEDYIYEEFPYEVDMVVDSFRDFINKFPAKVADPMINALDLIEETAGKEAVANALFNFPDAYHTYLYYVKMGDYKAAAIKMSSNIINMLPNLSESQKQKLEDAVTQLVYEDIYDEYDE